MIAHTLYVPACDNQGFPRPDVSRAVESALARAFGGYSATAVTGGWTRADGVQREAVTAYCTVTADPDARGIVESLARYVRRALMQDAVLIVECPVFGHFV